MDPDTAAVNANKARWNELVAHHVDSDFYDVPAFKAGRSTLKPPELVFLGDITGERILHLQCHFGMDTMSMARMGATVTGVDIAPKAAEAGNRLARELDLDATFLTADILSLPPSGDSDLGLQPGSFDTVYASFGVFGWIRDPLAWMRVACHHLRPGGRLILVDFHPVAQALGGTDTVGQLKCLWPYDGKGQPDPEDELDGSYAAPGIEAEHTRFYWWAHTLASILQAAVTAGLAVERFEEHDRVWWPIFPFLERVDPSEPDPGGPHGQGWQLQGGQKSIPLGYGVQVRKG